MSEYPEILIPKCVHGEVVLLDDVDKVLNVAFPMYVEYCLDCGAISTDGQATWRIPKRVEALERCWANYHMANGAELKTEN